MPKKINFLFCILFKFHAENWYKKVAAFIKLNVNIYYIYNSCFV